MLIVPNISDILMLQYIVNMIGQDGGTAPAGGHRLLRLYENNLTPGKSSVLTDFTETGAAGYASHTMTGTDWTTISSSGVNSAVYSEHIFTFTTGVTIYGYYVTTIESSPKLMWAERFSTSPYVLPSQGGEIGIAPVFTLN